MVPKALKQKIVKLVLNYLRTNVHQGPFLSTVSFVLITSSMLNGLATFWHFPSLFECFGQYNLPASFMTCFVVRLWMVCVYMCKSTSLVVVHFDNNSYWQIWLKYLLNWALWNSEPKIYPYTGWDLCLQEQILKSPNSIVPILIIAI